MAADCGNLYCRVDGGKRAVSEKKNPVLHMRESELRSRLRYAATTANLVAVACMMVAARDEFGFGRDRLNRLVYRCNALVEEINDGDIPFDEIVDTLEDGGLQAAFRQIGDRAKGFLDPGKKRG